MSILIGANDTGETASADLCSACMSKGSVEDQGSTSVPTVICRPGRFEEVPQVHGSGTGSMLLAQPRQ